MRRAIRGTVAGFSVALALCAARDSRAAGLDAIGTLTLEGAWDSNVFNSPAPDERSDSLLRVRPGLTLALRTLGTTFHLQGTVTAEEHAKFHQLDGVTAAKVVNLYPTDPIPVTSNLRVRPGGYFVETTDFRSRVFADVIPAAPGALPGEVVDLTNTADRATTREYAGSMDIAYTVTDKLQTDLRGSALRHTLLNVRTSTRDFRVYSARGNAFWSWTPRLQVGPQLRYTRTDYDEGFIVQVYQGSLAVRYLLREGQTVEARGGASHSQQDTQPPVDATSPYGFLSLDSTWQGLHALASGEYGIEQGGIIRGSSKRFFGRILLEKGFTPRTTGEFIGGFQRNWWGAPAVPETITVYTASGTLRYLIYRWASLRLGGTYLLQESSLPETRDLRRAEAFLGIDLTETVTIF